MFQFHGNDGAYEGYIENENTGSQTMLDEMEEELLNALIPIIDMSRVSDHLKTAVKRSVLQAVFLNG
jgi:hypothetical protein